MGYVVEFINELEKIDLKASSKHPEFVNGASKSKRAASSVREP